MAYPLAYVIVRYAKRWQKVLLAAVVLSFWTSGLLRAYAWMALLGDAGIINKGLRTIGLIDAPLPFLLYSPFAVVLVMTYFSLPFAVIALYASLEKMDWALVDAAADLGASPMRAFWHVTLPQTMPGVVSATVLTFVPLTGMFFVPHAGGRRLERDDRAADREPDAGLPARPRRRAVVHRRRRRDGRAGAVVAPPPARRQGPLSGAGPARRRRVSAAACRRRRSRG